MRVNCYKQLGNSKLLKRLLAAITLVTLLLSGGLLSPVPVRAEGTAISWTGTVGDGKWETANNWDLGRVPADGDVVKIPESSVVECANAGVTVSLDCAGELTVSGGTLTLTGNSYLKERGKLDGAGNIVVTGEGSVLTWQGVDILGTGCFAVGTGAKLEIEYYTTKDLKRPLSCNGTINLNAGNLRLSGGGQVDGQISLAQGTVLEFTGGNYTVNGSLSDTGTGASMAVDGGVIVFNGAYGITNTTVKSGATASWGGTAEATLSYLFVQGHAVFDKNVSIPQLNLSSGVIGGSGDITLTGDFNKIWSGGSIAGDGKLIILAGSANLNVSGSCSLSRYMTNNSHVMIGSGSSLELLGGAGGTGGYNVAATGTFRIGGTGSYSLGGPGQVTNNGQLIISDTCSKVELNTYLNQQSATGILAFDIGEAGRFCRMDIINNQALINGSTLKINLADDFVPADGATFEVMTYTSRSGSFASITSNVEGIVFEPAYGNTSLTLTAKAALEQAAAPIASPAAGTYAETQNVTLATTTDGATIHYTTDGSNPTIASNQYTGPIAVSTSMTIKAIATKTGMDDSQVAEFIYVIEAADEEPPVVLTYTPVNGAIGVALNTTALVLEFNEPVWGIDNKALRILQGDWLAAAIYAQSSDNDFMTGNGTTTVSFNISNVSLKLGTEYYIQIEAGALRDAFGNGYVGIDDKTTWTFKVEDDTQAPTVPTNLRCVSRTANAVELAWDASTDDHGPIRYHIHVKNGSQYDFVTESDTSSFTVSKLDESTPLIPNTTYTFVIRALDGSNNVSGYSSELAVATLAVASGEARITAFSFGEQTGPANINPDAGTIAIQVAQGTNVASLVATFALSTGASARVGDVDQVSGTTSNDFTNPVTYTVIAEDGSSTKNWTVTVTVAAPTEFAGGDGTEANPYLVETAAHLNNVRNHLDKHFKQIADIDLDVEPYKIGNGWEPIGSEANPFEGVYDGNGKAISNLFIGGTRPNVGLFGYIQNKTEGGSAPTVRNVSLVGVHVQGARHVGGLAGTVHSGAVESCSAAGEVSAHASLGNGQVVGGLIGQCYSGATIVDSRAAVNVKDQNSPSKGGLLGVSYGGTIESCSASGDVIGQANVGGLVGMAEANTTIIKSYSTGNVVGLNADVGGLVGRAVKTSIAKSYSTGQVQGGGQVGGLVGTLNNFGSITESCSTGDVQGQSDYVGGLVGRVINSSSVSKSYSEGKARGGKYVGGLVGVIEGNNLTVGECYSRGLVTCTDEECRNLGGLVGAASAGTVERSYWDTETSGQGESSGGGEGKNTGQMKTQATYVGWHFETIWNIDVAKNNGYPFLRVIMAEEPVTPSTEAEVTAFSFPQQTAPATINSAAGTIAVEVAHGTNVTNLVATFTLSAGASAKVGGVDQVSGSTANDFTNPLIYTVIAEDGTTTKSWPVAVIVQDPPPADDEPFWRYRSPLPTFRTLNEIKYLDGKFMALGEAGTLIVSTDGVSWESVCVDPIVTLRGLTYGTGLYVAVGYSGTSGKVYTSNDGEKWAQAMETLNHQLYDVAYGNNKFVAVGQGQKTVVSSDGITWDAKSAPLNSYLNSIIHTGDLYVAVGDSSSSYSKIVISSDGENWEARGSANCHLADVAYGNGILVAVGTDLTSNAKPRIYTSSDNGTTWTPHDQASVPGYTHTRLMTVEYDGSKFVAAGYSYSSDALYKQYVLTSTDGNVWTSISAQADTRFKALTVGNATLVGVGDYGDIVSSTDGVTWTKRTLGSNRVLDDVAYNGSTFVAVGFNGAIQTSDDGITWTARVSSTTERLGSVEYLNGKFIAVGNKGVILASGDGITWTKKTEANIDKLIDVTYGNGLHIIVGRYNNVLVILTSSDGATWSRVSHSHSSVASTITYGNGTFIALGYNQVYRSDNGSDWTGTYLSGMSPSDITYVDGRFVGTGEDGEVYISDDNGVTWTVKEKVAGVPDQINSVAYGGGNLVAVANNGKILISFDKGDTWEQQVSGFPLYLNGVVAGSSNFVAVGGSGLILQSKDFGTPGNPDADAVAADKTALTWDVIKGANSTQDNVTGNLVSPLPTVGANGTTITWSASPNGWVNTTTGEVTRPTYTQGDKIITLTATIRKGAASDTVTFMLTIKAADLTAGEAIALALEALTWDTIKGTNSMENNVTSNLVNPLPIAGANGTTIAWSASPTSWVDTDTGAVTRPTAAQGDQTVILTATISKDSASDTKSLTLTIIAAEPEQTDQEAIALDLEALTWDIIKGANSTENNVTGNLVNPLPIAGANGTTIAWSASSTSWVDTDTGAVTRPTAAQGNQAVTLIATISKGSISATKSFTLTIIAAEPEQTDQDAVALDLEALTWNTIKGANSSQTNVTSNLVLPTSGANGTTISWGAQPAGYVNTTNGVVTRPESSVGDATVTLTATISKGSASDTKAFNLVIKAKPAPYVPGPGPSPEPPPSTPPSTPMSIITALASTAADRLLDQSLLASGKAELSLADLAGNRLTISTAVIRQLAERGVLVTLRTENMTIVIEPAALLLEQITEWRKGKAQVEITVEEVVGEELEALLEQWQAPTRNGRFHVHGNIYQVGVELWENGQESGQTIEQFAQAITVMQHLSEDWSGELLAQLRVGLSNTDDSKLIWLELTPDMDTRSITFSTDLMGHFVTGWLELPTFVVDLGIDNSTGLVNGVENTMDVPPAIINDRTMVPVRFVAQALGARVDWLAGPRTVRIRLNGKVVELVIGQTDPENGLDVPAQIISNRTLVPLRFVSESLGAFVRWLPNTRGVEIVMFATTLE